MKEGKDGREWEEISKEGMKSVETCVKKKLYMLATCVFPENESAGITQLSPDYN